MLFSRCQTIFCRGKVIGNNAFTQRIKEWIQKDRAWRSTLGSEDRAFVGYVRGLLVSIPVNAYMLKKTDPNGDSFPLTFFAIMCSMLWPIGLPGVFLYSWFESQTTKNEHDNSSPGSHHHCHDCRR